VNLDQELKRVRWNGKIVTIPADSPLDLQQIDDESDEIIEEEEEDDVF
jgi:tRNA(Ser,Leu) C12 N-acetylase TAN1